MMTQTHISYTYLDIFSQLIVHLAGVVSNAFVYPAVVLVADKRRK